MEVQTECSEPPPFDPQPTGKLNKTAFKLFSRRKSGSSMPSIFSVRNKGESTGKAAGKPLELVRSKTHDGLITDTPSEFDGHRKEESASADQLHASTPDGVSTAPLRSSVTKSFSFFSLLRRSSSRAGEGTSTVGRRGRGLKGLFSSMRWRRKPQAHEDSGEVQEVAKEVKEGDLILSSDNMTEKEDITLTLEPLPQVFEDSPLPGDAGNWKGISMQELQGTNEVECDKCVPPLSSQHIVTEDSPAPSPLQTGGLQHDKHSGSTHLSSITTCELTPPMEHSTADPPSEQSVDRLCSMFTDVTSLKSFDSLTGCGDIIADPEEDSGNGGSATSSGTGSSSGGCMGHRLSGAGTNSERCSPAKPPLPPQVSSLASIKASCYMPAHQRACLAPKKPQGSGVVAYMGGGEEMASPEGVDDADMQGLWHMLPQRGEDSPAPHRAEPGLHQVQTKLEKRPPPVKGLQGLSKIPVSGSSKMGKQLPTRPSPLPVDKELQDAPPSDEGYWDSPTPGPEDEDSSFLRCDGLLKDSCSGDALYDLYDPDSPSAAGSDDDVSMPTKSEGDLKMSLPSKKCSSSPTSSFRSMKGSTSLPRDSKIPISVRQTPPSHSSSQGALSSNLSPTSKSPSKKTDAPPRTRIPVSKVPVRRTGNKSAPTTQSRK
ncbi:APC membrane recruitment protein 2 [Myxocyprinus asiaticus]|uniref:APC membrane recruitment protein 2 n=1 Tax=Myxocyprinus asiaticus TaxID=70543 RepID=UPI0022219394|nr:APC membrane recruitment protein 2 [Myxocyprinus asiaticus]